ncbi:AAA ATPase [Coemansia aciculifera]|uniref:Cell division control protein n=1 Tax=Coemansia aciculifera TaxID=417176 RepID=A0A9W8M864_9FUNG|nr:AAA ATPase [Coemansia aciculifera]KAJ2873801.1 AAA ATPase [Coemansia aciculifera]KAJ2884581.1 AAA ATPase [Coemansia aciculifera]
MPAARSARATAVKRKALAETPISRQPPPPPPVALAAQKAAAVATLKSAFPVTKHSNGVAVVSGKSAKAAKPVSSFVATKTVLHRSTAPPQIVGRESEQAAIRQFLQTTVEKGRGGSMYISGNPGTGKTACLQTLIKQSLAGFPSVIVNCVPLTRPEQAYAAVLDALNVEYDSADSALAGLERLVFKGKGAFLVILDEVDSLLGSKQEVLYRLFELAAHPDSRLALVGIANALDLTDRFLPRLQARNCVPILLNFNPYQVNDIVAILQSRLDSVATGEPVIQKAALELCARKVAATSGDLRKALDVCRQAVEAAEAECKKKAMSTDKENGPTASPVPKVSIMHIAKVLTSLNGSPIAQKLNALNFQQKLVLCAYASLSGNTGSSKPAEPATPSKKSVASGLAVSKLFSEYGVICDRLGMLAPVTRTEFLDLVAMMETQGVVTIETLKAGRRGGCRIASNSGAADDRTLRLAVDEADIRRALMSTPALSPIL